ncbi:hypothetical protein DFJ73DRAFT_847788, partial [Zopfochytrium polystomum]
MNDALFSPFFLLSFPFPRPPLLPGAGLFCFYLIRLSLRLPSFSLSTNSLVGVLILRCVCVLRVVCACGGDSY